MEKEYTFFWNGPFSQWYPSPFTVDGIPFTHAEQYMMYCKAKLFNDTEIMEKVLASTDPKEQKGLGRKVKNFDAQKWDRVARKVVYDGNYNKFKQNPKLLKQLLDTKGTTLVEASPYDTIWGIGLSEENAKKISPSNWPGKNWLGLTLTQLRDDIS